jgi:hypothetical protein
MTGVLVMGAVAHANTTISTFDNYNLGGVYAAWSDPNVTTITSNPTNYEIQSLGFGGGFAGLDPFPTNATGETTVNFNVTINAGDTPNVLALLEDGDGTQFVYRWFVLGPGNHALDAAINSTSGNSTGGEPYDRFTGNAGSTPGLNLATLSFLQLQVDAHGSNTPYDISFNDLRLTGVPEPAAISLLGVASLGISWLTNRRRGR